MKSFNRIISFIMFLIILSSAVFANTKNEVAIMDKYREYKSELLEILSLVKENPQNFNFAPNTPVETFDDFFTENTLVYPSYYCETEITAATAENFASIIPTEHKWHVKTGGNITTFKLEDGKWIWGGSSVNPNYSNSDFIDLTPSGVEALFKEKTNIDSFDEVKVLKLSVDYGRHIYGYARSENNEYLMGLEDDSLLAKKQAYTAEQAVYIFLSESKAKKEFLVKYAGKEVPDGVGNYTSPEDFDFSKIDLNELKTGNITFELKEEKPQNNTVWVILALVLTAALVAAAVVLGFKKKKA